MRLLVEEYQYDASKVENILKGVMDLRGIDGKISVNYVGYFYNPELQDCVFILPKVVLEDKDKKELMFGEYDSHDLVNLDKWYNQNKDTDKGKQIHDFIYELSVWIYRSLVVFRDNLKKDGKKSDIILEQHVQQMGNGRTAKLHTFLDVLLSLLRFNRENQNFFFFILRNMRSGFNKINWTRTISHSTAFVQNEAPIYIDPVNKKRQINFDEELIIIFFSILNYIHEHYGFPVKIDINFPLIKGDKFQAYINGMGCMRLRQIKYKYFSDKAIYLWELCFAFFDRCRDICVQTTEKEYLLVKSYYVVFESIIDELIGDKEIPAGLKEQDDGKRIDHLYTYYGLTNESGSDKDSIYYIGDSKYYKRGHEIGKEAVYKQFTYAKNVIQWNLNLFMNGGNDDDLKKDKENDKYNQIELRDSITEGYNVIPNFFISAKLNDKLDFEEELDPTDNENKHFENRHFENRLFDRDTLLISHYNVNFLHIISMYARNSESEKHDWKNRVRETFRKQIQGLLIEKYDFSALSPHPGTSFVNYFNEHFHDLNGKVYKPKGANYAMLALEKPKDNAETSKLNNSLLQMLAKDFYIVEYNSKSTGLSLGDNPESILNQQAKEYPAITSNQILVVLAGSQEQMEWVKKQHWYNLPLGKANDIPELFKVQTLLIHCGKSKLLCTVPKTSNMKAVTSEQLKVDYKYYKEPSHKEGYLLIRLQNIEESDIDINNLKVVGNDAERKQSYWWGIQKSSQE